jgi:Ribosomal protein L7/L12 C-terminal domain
MIVAMDSSDIDRVVRLERQVDFLFRRLGIDPDVALADDDALPSALYDAIARGKLIQAIKIYREATGVGLKEAKDAVDAMAGKGRR